MKILVPTDFSVFSMYAVDAAILLAEKTNGEILLVHAFNPPNIGFDDMPMESKVVQSILKKRKTKMNILENKISAKQIPVSTELINNNIPDSIAYLDSSFNSDLIIMGSHGVSGKEEWFIGSNTQKVVRKLHKNVLVLKQPLSNLNFQKACYVSNLDLSSKAAFIDFMNFIKIFDVKNIDVLTIDTSSYFSQPTVLIKALAKDFKEIAEDFNVNVVFYQDYTVAAGVDHFTAENDIHIIGISNKERHRLKRIFQGSNVEMIINHSDIPVLSIDS